MHRATRANLFAVLVTLLFSGIGGALLVANAPAPAALAQAGNTVFLPQVMNNSTNAADTVTTTETATAPTQITTTLTVSDFDNTVFILAPSIHPAFFLECVDNRYFPLIPGTIFDYRAETEDGVETSTVTVTNELKEIIGIAATVVHDTVWLDGELLEDTFDWYAQDVRGNVWYLGEDVSNYEGGQLVDKAGSWEAGVDGAVPGIIMLGQPLPGDVYREEYLEGEATDMGGVLSLDESISIAFGDFDNALMTAAYNPLDGELEHKFYVSDVGLAIEEIVGGDETKELVSVRHDPSIVTDGDRCTADDDDDDDEDDDEGEDDDAP
jgi:hypothetical protein